MTRRLLFLLALCTFAAPAAVAQEDEAEMTSRRAVFTTMRAMVAEDATDAGTRRHCCSGCPKLDRTRFDFGPTMVITNMAPQVGAQVLARESKRQR